MFFVNFNQYVDKKTTYWLKLGSVHIGYIYYGYDTKPKAS